jgi:hypothetical protein
MLYFEEGTELGRIAEVFEVDFDGFGFGFIVTSFLCAGDMHRDIEIEDMSEKRLVIGVIVASPLSAPFERSSRRAGDVIVDWGFLGVGDGSKERKRRQNRISVCEDRDDQGTR